MKDALNLLLQEAPLDASSETLLCNELAITSDQIEKLKLSNEHEALINRIENILKQTP